MGITGARNQRGLFIRTRDLTEHKEDHLTEFLVAALQADEALGSAYVDTVFQGFAQRKNWPHPLRIVEAQPQVVFRGQKRRPDMMLTLAGEQSTIRVICGHKIDASMGPAKETDGAEEVQESDDRRQLPEYLKLPDVDAVAYFRAGWENLPSSVVNHCKYIRPSVGDHFLWRDLYPVLRAGSHDLSRWIAEGFEFLGFTPPHPTIGDLEAKEEKELERNRRNFAKLWDRTRDDLTRRGWRVTTGSICALVLTNNERSHASRIAASPLAHGRLRVRVTPRAAGATEVLRQPMQDLLEERGLSVEVVAPTVVREAGHVPVIDVYIALSELLPESISVPEYETRLQEYTRTVIDVAEGVLAVS